MPVVFREPPHMARQAMNQHHEQHSIHKHRVKGAEGKPCNVEIQTHFKVGVLTVNNCNGGSMFSVV